MSCITVIQTCNICEVAICPPRTYLIQNFKSVGINQRSGNAVLPIPQLPACPDSPKTTGEQSTIVIKTEGNVTNVDVSWTILDSDGIDLASCSQACNCPTTITTVPQQLDYLLCCFENVGIQEKYTVQIGCCYGPKKVKPQNISITKTCSSPITWNATWTFVIGDIKISTCESSECP